MPEPTIPETIKLLLGPILALIPILIWETVIKPNRERLKAGRLLRLEVHQNLNQMIQTRVRMRNYPDEVIADFHVSFDVFDALKGQLGELPEHILEPLLRLNRGLHYLEQTAQESYNLSLPLLKANVDPVEQRRVALARASAATGMLAALDKNIQRADDLVTRLDSLVREAFEATLAPLDGPRELEAAAVRRLQRRNEIEPVGYENRSPAT